MKARSLFGLSTKDEDQLIERFNKEKGACKTIKQLGKKMDGKELGAAGFTGYLLGRFIERNERKTEMGNFEEKLAALFK